MRKLAAIAIVCAAFGNVHAAPLSEELSVAVWGAVCEDDAEAFRRLYGVCKDARRITVACKGRVELIRGDYNDELDRIDLSAPVSAKNPKRKEIEAQRWAQTQAAEAKAVAEVREARNELLAALTSCMK